MALLHLQQEYMDMPLITRAYTTVCFVTTTAVNEFQQLDLVTPFQLYFNPTLIFRHGQLWRLLTSFCFFGTFGFSFIFNMIFTYRYCRMLEEGSFRGKTADFFLMFLFGGVFMTVGNEKTQIPWQSLHGLLVSTYSQAVPYERLRHDYGISELKRRLLGLTRKFDAMRKSLTVPAMEKSRQRSLSNSSRQLKLPPLSSSYNSALRSDNSPNKQQGKEPAASDFGKMSISKKKRRKSTKAIGRSNNDSQAREQDQEEEQQTILPPLETSYSNSNNSKSSHSTDSLNRTSSSPSQLDSRASELNGDAYHGTYYLIFPNMGSRNAAEKPLLIRFPDDVVSPADENNSSSRMERELRDRGLIYTLTANDEEEAAVDGEPFALLAGEPSLTSGSATPLADFLGDL